MSCVSMSSSLGHLTLTPKKINNENADDFTQLIRTTRSIYQLNMKSICTISALRSILAALCYNESLVYFRLTTRGHSTVPAADILAVLHKNRYLVELDLKRYMITNPPDECIIRKYIDPEDPHAKELREAVGASHRLIEISGIFYPFSQKIIRMQSGVDRANIEARWILHFGRIFACSRFKGERPILPVELFLLILKNVSVGGYWLNERRNSIICSVLDRRTVGKLYSEYLDFSVGSLEYLCKQSAL
jgi:hypothetical protein